MKDFWHTITDLFFDLIKFNDKKPIRFFVLWISMLGLIFYIFYKDGIILNSINFLWILEFLYKIWPLWVPFILLFVFLRYWLRYVRTENIMKEGNVLLEIRTPEETNKTPLAMEIFLTSLYQTGSMTLFDAYWKGKIKPWFSLELVSLEGKVRFFIWAPKKFKNLIESQLYAQYPNIEIFESKDYATATYYNPDEMTIWGTYFKLTEKDVYPIKTYVDYGMDKPGEKEEFKTDPMSAVIEYLGSIGKGEQVWIQILIQAHTEEGLTHGRWFKKEDWKKEIDEEIENIRKSTQVKLENGGYSFPNPTPGQIEKIKALERSKGKFPFDTMIRGYYIAEKDSFNPINITGLIGSVRQYSSNNLNGFKLGWFTDFDYVKLQDLGGKRVDYRKTEMMNAYKRRSFFQYPYRRFYQAKPIILMTEELATIYHLPGGVAQTPTFERIMSKKAEPPANLPI